ncbi:hypothetical protein [Streptomyces sp. NPDC002746]
MKRTLYALGVGASATLLSISVAAGTASAATGTFTYTEFGTGKVFTLTDPNGNDCFKLPNDSSETYDIVNNTDKKAWVYQNNDCSGSGLLVDPGTGDGFGSDGTASVTFAR